MLWLSLILIGLAIVLWRYGHQRQDEIEQFLCLSLALVSVLVGLIVAPWLLKIILFTGLLLYPTCTCPAPAALPKPDCPRTCPRRR